MNLIMANMLTQQEHFKASLWIKDNYSKLEGLSRPEIAKRVALGVGFPITEHNVSAIAEMLGIKDKLRGPHGRQPGFGSIGRTRERDMARAIIEMANFIRNNLSDNFMISNEHRLEQIIANHGGKGEQK